MNENKGVFVDTWPVLLDEGRVWCASGLGPWRSDTVPYSSTVQYEMEWTLHEHGVRHEDVLLSHGTSDRDGKNGVTLVYIAVLDPTRVNLANFPDALPIDAELREAAGKPPTHGPHEAPTVRKLDPLIHALRTVWGHIDPAPGNKFFDATLAAAVGPEWARALGDLDPALAGLYSVEHSAA